VHLQELLEVQIGHLLAILGAQELAELLVRHDATLERGVKAAVRLDIRRNELGDIRLGALRLRGQAHEGGQLIGDRAELQECVVRAASIVHRTLLGRHRRGVLAHAALRIAGLTANGLRCIRRLTEQLAHTGGHLSAQGAQAVLDGREECIARAGLGGGGQGRHSRSDRGSDRDINNRLGGSGGLGGGGGGSLLSGSGGGLRSGGHVCSIGGVGARHF